MFLEGVTNDAAAYGSTNGAQGATATADPTSSAMGEMGRNEFLKLLVTQLENQNPLEPMQDTEFVAQLATFSSLEQLIDMNSRMDTVIAGQAEMVNAQALDLVGREVLLDTGGEVRLEDGEAETIVFEMAEAATAARVDIYDESGRLVRSIEMDNPRSGRHEVTWDGLDDGGDPLNSGGYRAEVVLGTVETGESTITPWTSMPVRGLHVGPNGIALTSNARVVALSDVLEIRAGDGNRTTD